MRLGHETGTGLNTAREVDVTIMRDELGHRLGEGCSRLINDEEGKELKRNGVLKCPGPQNEQGHLLIEDTEAGYRFRNPTDRGAGLGEFGPCGNHMTDLRKDSKGKVALRPEMYCKTCHFSLRMFKK